MFDEKDLNAESPKLAKLEKRLGQVQDVLFQIVTIVMMILLLILGLAVVYKLLSLLFN